jgi:hypothetical protein
VRALKTLLKLSLWLALIAGVAIGLVMPSSYMYTAANLPNQIDSESDVELHLRQSIESDRKSVV